MSHLFLRIYSSPQDPEAALRKLSEREIKKLDCARHLVGDKDQLIKVLLGRESLRSEVERELATKRFCICLSSPVFKIAAMWLLLLVELILIWRQVAAG